jgi:anthranilate synthase component 2
MNILILDNYDSFTYNLVHIVKKLGYQNVSVIRNDKMTVEEVAAFDKILLSPGPGIPSEAGILMDLLRTYNSTKSILGVCLGHQAIAESFGGELFNLSKVVHGKSVKTNLCAPDILFKDVPSSFLSGRYHSWAVKKENLPNDLIVSAEDENGVIMALKHAHYDVRGVQFHPESIMTEYGETMMRNWLEHKV